MWKTYFFEKKKKSFLLRSFSLFELLIYITILAVVVLFISQAILPIKRIERRSQAAVELEKNINSILNSLSYNIRMASSVNSVSAHTLSLKMSEGSIDPTVFTFSDGRIYIQQGSGDAISLVNSKVYIDSFSFEKIINQLPAKNSIKISFSLHYNWAGKGNSPLSKTIKTTFNLR